MAGVIPPNPMELIASVYTNQLFQELKKSYDYVIVDSPPVGMVSDALLLVKYSDINIFVVRYNNTYKKALAQLSQNLHKKEIQKVNIVFNDVYLQKSYQGYNYNYSYGYGYSNNKSTSKFKKIFGFLYPEK